MKTIKKSKDGSSFAKLAPPYDKATYADKIAGATKGKAKNGKPVKKAAIGALLPLAMKAAPMIAGMLGGKKKKMGGSIKKCKYGCK